LRKKTCPEKQQTGPFRSRAKKGRKKGREGGDEKNTKKKKERVRMQWRSQNNPALDGEHQTHRLKFSFKEKGELEGGKEKSSSGQRPIN